MRSAVCFAVLIVFGVGLFLLRNAQMNEGMSALKIGHGAVALEKFTPFAKLGDSKAQFLIGSMYAYGWGVVKNDEDAIYWFRRAAMFAKDETDPAAAAALGVAMSYANGTDGVKVDSVESDKWLRFAAKGGSKEAEAILAKLKKGNESLGSEMK